MAWVYHRLVLAGKMRVLRSSPMALLDDVRSLCNAVTAVGAMDEESVQLGTRPEDSFSSPC